MAIKDTVAINGCDGRPIGQLRVSRGCDGGMVLAVKLGHATKARVAARGELRRWLRRCLAFQKHHSLAETWPPRCGMAGLLSSSATLWPFTAILMTTHHTHTHTHTHTPHTEHYIKLLHKAQTKKGSAIDAMLTHVYV